MKTDRGYGRKVKDMSNAESAAGFLKGRKILLVEDNDQLYCALRESLADAGADVLGAVAFMPRGTGIVPLTHIDVAIIDASSRSSNWLVLARELQQRGIPGVFIAAERLSFMNACGCRYLSKPFTEEQFLVCVGAALNRVADAPLHAAGTSLRDRTVLLVEDDYVVAMDLYQELERSGAIVIGPVGSVEDALATLENTPELDAAVLDIRLRDDDVYAVADVLTRRNIPFVFATGYDRSNLPQRYLHVPWSQKPFDLRVLTDMLLHAEA
ncbi:MAG TPA: hypothetical protein VKB34_19865 [Povalibacter sp.]|nr:hypothetical protein [Povalibacter sp.]